MAQELLRLALREHHSFDTPLSESVEDITDCGFPRSLVHHAVHQSWEALPSCGFEMRELCVLHHVVSYWEICWMVSCVLGHVGRE